MNLPAAGDARVFAFGENWRRFLDAVTEYRIQTAEQSLRDLLRTPALAGKTFLDVGCGSGLFSLAARRLGATVRSFDADPASVACAHALKKTHFAGDAGWRIESGSALDGEYLKGLGTFDVVYSWGVLHHTGDLWRAVDLVRGRVGPEGSLVLALYNDAGPASRHWWRVKRLYNRAPRPVRGALLLYGLARLWGPAAAKDLFKGDPFGTWRRYESRRGMSPWIDVVDWVGGWPYEFAAPAAVQKFLEDRGFSLEKFVPVHGFGCNEYVFKRRGAGS